MQLLSEKTLSAKDQFPDFYLREIEEYRRSEQEERGPNLRQAHARPLLAIERRISHEADHGRRIPFIGVRISWLMAARKRDLARLAASADRARS